MSIQYSMRTTIISLTSVGSIFVNSCQVKELDLSQDVGPGQLKISPNPPVVGKPFNVATTVSYCCNLSKGLDIEFKINEVVKESRSIETPGRSGTVPMNFSYMVDKPGIYNIAVHVDPKDVIFERFETDNISTISIEVKN